MRRGPSHRDRLTGISVPLQTGLAIAGIGWADAAVALPTPDVVAGVFSVVPAVLGAIGAATAAITYRFRDRFGQRALDLLAGALAGSLLVAVAGAWLGSAESEVEADAHAALATFLRCDLSAHETYSRLSIGPTQGLEAWSAYGSFQIITMAEAEARLRSDDTDVTLLATYRHEIQYDSGVPAVVTGDGQLRPFELVRRGELADRLAEIPGGDLYLAKFSPARREPASYSNLLDSFRQFRNVFVIDNVSPEYRHVRDSDGWAPADPTRVIDWPVASRSGLFDEGAVTFPGITNLLGDGEATELVANRDILLVAPNNGYLRDPDVYFGNYLPRMLGDLADASEDAGADGSRLFMIDIYSDSISAELDELAAWVDGRPFIVIGTTRYDFTDQGIDVAYSIWRRLGRDPERFRLQGFTARLPDVVARVWTAESETGWAALVGNAFLAGVRAIEAGLAVPLALAVMLFGALLRLAATPFAFEQVRSRTIRSEVRRMESLASAPGVPDLLERRLGSGVARELPGAILTLALLLPAFDALTGPGLGGSALWIADIGAPDATMALIIGVLVAFKLLMGMRSWQRAILLSAATMLAFLWVPAIVLLYLAGSLAISVVQDAVAMEVARWQMARALRFVESS